MVTGVALLVSLSLLFASAAVVYSGGELKPLAAIYSWSCNSNQDCGRFTNTNTGSIADGLWGLTAGSGGWGVYGYSSGSGGLGVYGYSPNQGVRGYSGSGIGAYGRSANYIGVRGEGGSGSGDYGGFFTGYEGARGIASGSNGYGTWGTAYGTYGIGAYGYANGSYGYGMYGYSYRYIGVRGYGPIYGGYFNGGYAGVFGVSTSSSRRGVYGYATASAGEGVRGYTAGYGGDGVTAYATNSYGYGVDSTATGYRGVGIRATSGGTSAYAGIFSSASYRGIYANGASGWYDAYFPDIIYAGGSTLGSFGLSMVALNDGSEALEAGDLVAFSGFDASAGGSSGPALAVKKVNGANSSAIIGVVQGAYVKEEPVEMQPAVTMAEAAPAAVDTAVTQKEDVPLPGVEEVRGEEPPLPLPQPQGAIEIEQVVPESATPSGQQAESFVDADVGHFVEGAAQPGQYVLVVVQGIARVKVDASAAPVRVGDMLVASPAGFATAQLDVATARSREGVAERGISQGLVIGRALESLEAGTGMIYVFVSVR